MHRRVEKDSVFHSADLDEDDLDLIATTQAAGRQRGWATSRQLEVFQLAKEGQYSQQASAARECRELIPAQADYETRTSSKQKAVSLVQASEVTNGGGQLWNPTEHTGSR